MVSAETPSERARAPSQRRLVLRRAKITLKYGWCVSLGAVLEGKLIAARKRQSKKLVKTFFFFWSSLQVWLEFL